MYLGIQWWRFCHISIRYTTIYLSLIPCLRLITQERKTKKTGVQDQLTALTSLFWGLKIVLLPKPVVERERIKSFTVTLGLWHLSNIFFSLFLILAAIFNFFDISSNMDAVLLIYYAETGTSESAEHKLMIKSTQFIEKEHNLHARGLTQARKYNWRQNPNLHWIQITRNILVFLFPP